MHDRYGNPVKVGDEVVLRGTIVSVSPNMLGSEENKYCNLTFVADVKMGLDDPKAYPMNVTVNAGQVELVKHSEEIPNV